MPPFSATLVSLAALGESNTRVVLQLPHGAHMEAQHCQDMFESAKNLHKGTGAPVKVVEVDALQSLRDAKAQCAVSPGAVKPIQEPEMAADQGDAGGVPAFYATMYIHQWFLSHR